MFHQTVRDQDFLDLTVELFKRKHLCSEKHPERFVVRPFACSGFALDGIQLPPEEKRLFRFSFYPAMIWMVTRVLNAHDEFRYGWDDRNRLVLWERIERREPNAYLTLLYWDSEMFHRSTRKRRQMEGEVQKDYKAILTEMLLKHPEKYFTNPGTYRVAMQYRRFFIKSANMMTPKSMRTMHDALVAGDPKLRSLRALFTTVYTDYANYNRADIARRKEADEA